MLFSQPLNHAILSLLLLGLLLYWCFSGKSLCMFFDTRYLSGHLVFHSNNFIRGIFLQYDPVQAFFCLMTMSVIWRDKTEEAVTYVWNKRHAVLDEPLLPPIHNLHYSFWVYWRLWRIWCSNKCFCEPPGNSLQCSYPLTLFCNLKCIHTTQACVLSVGKATAFGVIRIGAVSLDRYFLFTVFTLMVLFSNCRTMDTLCQVVRF